MHNEVLDISNDSVREQVYLIERGVRSLALIGTCENGSKSPNQIADELDNFGLFNLTNTIPFVIEAHDKIYYGYSNAKWAIDLFKWVMITEMPEIQRDRILGLLFGYSIEAIAHFEDSKSGRLF